MMKMKNKHTGSILNIREFFITKGNLWEYFVTDEEVETDDVQFCLVRGFEQELGCVSMAELRPYIMIKVKINKKNYHEVLPAQGYEWVAE